MSNTFNINLERYSGPYYKILELIEDRKLSINEFSLSQITDEYIIFIKNLENQNTTQNKIDLSEFILTASTLMLIKAKSLFPNLNYTEDEKGEIQNLEKRLEFYKIMQNASKNISKNFNQNILYSLAKHDNKETVFVFDSRLNKTFLQSIAIATILKFPKVEKFKQITIHQMLKIEDVIEKLMARINLKSQINFTELPETLAATFKSLEERKNAFIVSFLAMLELIKNRMIDAEQNDNHSEITISARQEI